MLKIKYLLNPRIVFVLFIFSSILDLLISKIFFPTYLSFQSKWGD